MRTHQGQWSGVPKISTGSNKQTKRGRRQLMECNKNLWQDSRDHVLGELSEGCNLFSSGKHLEEVFYLIATYAQKAKMNSVASVFHSASVCECVCTSSRLEVLWIWRVQVTQRQSQRRKMCVYITLLYVCCMYVKCSSCASVHLGLTGWQLAEICSLSWCLRIKFPSGEGFAPSFNPAHCKHWEYQRWIKMNRFKNLTLRGGVCRI